MCWVEGRRFIVLYKLHSIRWFMKMTVWSLSISPWKTEFIRVLPTRWRRKPLGIETATVTLCILEWLIYLSQRCLRLGNIADVRPFCAVWNFSPITHGARRRAEVNDRQKPARSSSYVYGWNERYFNVGHLRLWRFTAICCTTDPSLCYAHGYFCVCMF